MSPVGGSRHYDGGGLGEDRGWRCPACGTENQGPLAQGCTFCGGGKPGRHVGRDAAPPPPPEPPVVDEEPLGPFDRWALAHPQATLEDAFTAGYVEGVREARRQEQARNVEPVLPPEEKVARTIVAALAFFADQILRGNPEEVARGEWCSVDEVRQLIKQITTTGELAHA